MAPRLSVIIITRDEAANIASCLESCAFADEWVVVDSGSADDTVAIARGLGATVSVRTDWEGFGVQKNRALEMASGDWVLALDADERVTDDLKRQITAAIADSRYDGYVLRTETCFYGFPVRRSEFYANTSSIRLFKRALGRFRPVLVHESIELASVRVGRLTAPLLHLSFVHPDAYLRKVNQYSALQAQMLFDQGRRSGYASALMRSAAAFIKSYVVRWGFLDGRAGFMVAVLAAELTYHKYFRLMLLTRADSGLRVGGAT